MKAILVIVAVLALSTGVGAANSAGFANDVVELSADIILPGRVFDIGEPIPYELKVTNRSAGKVTLPRPSDSIWVAEEFSIEITDETGRLLPNPVESGTMSMLAMGGGTSPLGWGESVSYKGYINCLAILDKPGAYTLTFKWKTSVNAMDPQITSEPRTIRLIKPSEQDHNKRYAEAVEKLKSAGNYSEKSQRAYNLAFTLDPRAIPIIVQASGSSDMSYIGGQLLHLFRDRQAVQQALMNELREHGINKSIAFVLPQFIAMDKTVVPFLEKALKEGDTEQRVGALWAVSEVKQEDVSPSLRQLALDSLKDSRPTLRYAAVMGLRFDKSSDTIDRLLPLAASDPDTKVRNMAVMTLGLLSSDKAVPLLAELVSGKDEELVRSAIEALKSLGTPATAKVLEQCSQSEVQSTCEQCKKAWDWFRTKQHKTQQ